MLENLGLDKQCRHLDRRSKEFAALAISKVSGAGGTNYFSPLLLLQIQGYRQPKK